MHHPDHELTPVESGRDPVLDLRAELIAVVGMNQSSDVLRVELAAVQAEDGVPGRAQVPDAAIEFEDDEELAAHVEQPL